MSAFLDALRVAAAGTAGMTTGEPHRPVRTSWADIHQRALGGAAVLAAQGLRPGQAVAILAGTPAEVAPAAQAVWLAGGSVTMLHQPTARTRIEHYAGETLATLRVIGARLVIVGEPFTHLVDLLAGTGIAAVTIAQLADGNPAQAPDVHIEESEPALLQLTSGSTATPKAVRITHGNLWANLEALCSAARIRAIDDVMVSWLPLFHDMGMVGFLTLPMCRGVELVTVTPADFLASPLLWAQLISKYRGTVTAAPNFAYALAARVLGRATDLDLSSLRFALNGAEPIDVRTAEAFLRAGQQFGLPATAVVCAYGMAEATLGVSLHPWGTPLEVDTIAAGALENERRAEPVSADTGSGARSFPVLGPPLPGIECVAVDENGRHLGDREVGVLHIRGSSVTELYLTVDGPRPTRGADGWLDTGDLGYLVDGRVVVCGRVKDVIIMGGRNIYPTDIERVAEQVPGVRAGNAVAVRWLEGPRESFAVAVESREAADADAVERMSKQIRSAVTAAIGVRPALVSVLPVGTLPKTPSGKLQRTAAAALLR